MTLDGTAPSRASKILNDLSVKARGYTRSSHFSNYLLDLACAPTAVGVIKLAHAAWVFFTPFRMTCLGQGLGASFDRISPILGLVTGMGTLAAKEV